MSREAMRLALEALHDPWSAGPDGVANAITALRAALSESEQKSDPGAWHGWVQREVLFDNGEPIGHREPEQEPVAWMHNFIEGGISIGKKPTDLNRHPDRWTALYKDPTPCKTCQALAMAVMNDQTYHEKIIPKREWVGLTDEDIHDAFNFTEMVKQLSWDREPEQWCKNFAAYIEAKLKEKNG